MSDCVFDIETAPLPDADIPPAFVEKLRDADEDDESWREQLGLHALSARVIVIGMLNPDTDRGLLLYDDQHGELDPAAFEGPLGTDFTLVGGDEAKLGALGFLQLRLQILHVGVLEAVSLGLAEPDPVDDAGVVERIADDGALFIEERLEQSAVGVEAG